MKGNKYSGSSESEITFMSYSVTIFCKNVFTRQIFMFAVSYYSALYTCEMRANRKSRLVQHGANSQWFALPSSKI